MIMPCTYSGRRRTGRHLGWALPALVLILSACDIDSVDSTSAMATDGSGSATRYDFSGLYLPVNGAEALVYPANRQSGTMLTWLRLLQYGRVLEGYDSAGQSWDGNLSSIMDGNANFTLHGRTTAGAAVEIVGVLRYADQRSTLDGAWIEPGFSGNILAQATTAPPAPVDEEDHQNGTGDNGDNGGAEALEISPGQRWFVPSGGTSGTFTASGGTAPYAWSVSNAGLGTISPTTGITVTYTTTQTMGTNTVTVRDAAGATATAIAYYQ